MTVEKQHIVKLVENLLGDLAVRNNMTFRHCEISAMSEWQASFENDELTIFVHHDRRGSAGIQIGCKIRPRPRAQLKQWWVSQIRGFFEGSDEQYLFADLAEEVAWLKAHETKVLDCKLINSDELQKWAVKASRKQFGQDK